MIEVIRIVGQKNRFQYDAAGNQKRALAADGVTWVKYEYDAANRVHKVVRDDAQQTNIQEFRYGSSNARLIDYDAAGTGRNTFYASVGGTVLAEYTEYSQNIQSWTKSYTYLGDSQLSTITPNGLGGEYTEYNHPDRLGTKLVTNQTLGTAYEQAHLPFGKALNAESTITTNNKRFTSYDRSSLTGLDYALNRTYDNKLGRFTQVDPIGMHAASLTAPQTLNLYTYCGNDPINHTDPSGLFWGKLFNFIKKAWKWIAVLVVVALVIASLVATHGGSAGLLGQLGSLFSKLGLAHFVAGEGLAASLGLTGKVLLGVSGVGAIANNFQTTQRRKKKRDWTHDIQEIVNRAGKGALDRLKGRCKDYIEGASGLDAKKVLQKIRERRQITHDPARAGGNVAKATEGAGMNGSIYLGDTFFTDNPGGYVNKSGPRGFSSATKFRQLAVLHELRHVVTGITHETESNEEFNRNISNLCF